MATIHPWLKTFADPVDTSAGQEIEQQSGNLVLMCKLAQKTTEYAQVGLSILTALTAVFHDPWKKN